MSNSNYNNESGPPPANEHGETNHADTAYESNEPPPLQTDSECSDTTASITTNEGSEQDLDGFEGTPTVHDDDQDTDAIPVEPPRLREDRGIERAQMAPLPPFPAGEHPLRAATLSTTAFGSFW